MAKARNAENANAACRHALAERIAKAARRIRNGEVVAFPTETVYGLGANAFDEQAVAKIYALKGRPSDNPLIVHVSDEAMLKAVVKRIPAKARLLMRSFWPGPLTIIFEKGGRIPPNVCSLPTVAVRMPSHPIARELIAQAGVPVAAPSANKSGSPSPTSAQHVREDFHDHPDLLVLDGGDCGHGLESTVIAIDRHPRVLRLGAITLEQLKEAIPDIAVSEGHGGKPESPGMKYRHYAPKQPLILFRPRKGSIAEMKRCAKAERGAVILCKDTYAKRFPGYAVIALGRTDADVARNLFAALRTKKGRVLLVLGVPKRSIGRAIMDRLERAATKIV